MEVGRPIVHEMLPDTAISDSSQFRHHTFDHLWYDQDTKPKKIQTKDLNSVRHIGISEYQLVVMGRSKTACRTCAAIKTLCSGDGPCARCQRLSLPCSLVLESNPSSEAGPSAGQSAATDAPSNPTKLRARSERSSRGCSSCRRRRKKCDEKQPICGDCERLGLECHLRDSSRRREGGGSPKTPSSVSVLYEDSVASYDSEPFTDWVSTIAEVGACENYHATNLANSSALEVVPEAYVSDESHLAEPLAMPINALSTLTGVTADMLADWTTGERHLLHHFLQSVARALVMVRDEENPFLRIITPMIFESSLVRQAIAALSACHLAKIYPDFERNLLVHRSKALETLKTQIDRGEATLWGLTATLLLCLSEICEGSSSKWQLYSQGARALIVSLGADASGPVLDFLIDLYNYLACISAVTLPYPAMKLVDNCFHTPTSQSTPDITSTPSLPFATRFEECAQIHPLFGFAIPMYKALAQINSLLGRLQEADRYVQAADPRDGAQREDLLQEARQLDYFLHSWDPPTDDGAVDTVEARAAAFAVKWAAIIRLHQAVPDLREVTGGTVDLNLANNILSAVSLIRPGSHIEAHMLFPLFMAGVESTTKANRLTVEYRINIIQTTVGFWNIQSAHRLLDEIWRRKNNRQTVKWDEIVEQVSPGLILF